MLKDKTNMTTDELLDLLRQAPKGYLFNPWWQIDPENDDYNNSCEIRRHQLQAYLEERLGKAHILLVGEAMGYQGGHFSGIAMTSERILLGKMLKKGISPDDVFTSLQPSRTSKVEVRADGFNEPTATIVWEHMLASGVNPYSFAIWNSLPWHPYNPEKGMLSNRTPTDSELSAGREILKVVIDMLKPAMIIAVGEKAAIQMEAMNIPFHKVRHPANGGANTFRMQITQLLEQSKS